MSRVKVGRNDPCTCGSGNKYKKCCESKESISTSEMESTDPWDYLSFHITRSVLEKTDEVFDHGKTERAAYALINTAIQYSDTMTERILEDSEIAKIECKKGCSFCCYVPVTASVPELFEIVKYLKESRNPEEISSLKERLGENSERIKNLTRLEHADTKMACALLGKDGQCTVYPSRPLLCRGWTSFSKAKCEKAFNFPNKLNVPINPQLKVLAAGTQNAIKVTVEDTGLDASCYELHSGLLRALTVPDALNKWLHKKKVFLGCKGYEAVGVCEEAMTPVTVTPY